MKSFSWPKEAAKRTKLRIPEEYGEDTDVVCLIRYDSERKLLLVVSAIDGEILDVIDPKDVVGASVEIKLFGDDDGCMTQQCVLSDRSSTAADTCARMRHRPRHGR